MKAITGAIALLLTTTAAPVVAQDSIIYRGGPIVTMDGDRPRLVKAVVTRGDKIAFAGSEKEARRVAGKDAVTRDLKGATMLPGFIDAHSHFTFALQMAGALDLSDKAAPQAKTIAELQAAVRDHIARRAIPKGDWVVVMQYNEEALTERRHITRAELDAVSPDHKIVLFHISFHGLVANSSALAAAKLTDASQPPPGGLMLRDDAGRLNGVLLEKAMFTMIPAMPQPTAEQKLAGLDALLAQPDLKFGTYNGHVKLQGIKFLLDGSPQARTAFFTRDYARGGPDGAHPWHGQPIIQQAEFDALARKVNDRGWQIFVHANGDAAIDMAIKGFDAIGIKAVDNRRPIVIHSQFQRRDQLADYARIGVGPAYFSNHTWYWGDIHRTNFPAEVVDFISPFASARAAGLTPSNHSDYSVTPLDTRFMLWTSMARASPTGVISGPAERLDAYAALQALTTGPAWQIFEEDRKGRIKPGLLADFVILDKNPLATPMDAIKDIKVLETIKQARPVWSAKN